MANYALGKDVLALIRVFSILIYFLLINILLILICVVRPFHRDNVHTAGKLYSSTSRLLGLTLEVRVPAAVHKGGPFVFIANHQNSYDILTICAAALKGTVTVGKKSLKWIPLFGQVYWLSGNILIDRRNTDKAMSTLNKTVEKIKQRNLSVWFFPEGTRSYGRGLLPFKSGAFRIAKTANKAMVTVCASNMDNKIKLNRWDNGTLIIELGEPVILDDSKTVKEWSEHFYQQMKINITKLDSELAQRPR